MRSLAICFGVLSLLAASCQSAKSVPEPGSVLLNVKCAPGLPNPDELRAFVYDDGGAIWENTRIPETGALKAKSQTDLGTVLIQPRAIQGALRIHLQGLSRGTRIMDGMLSIPQLDGKRQVFDILLSGGVPADGDGDGVPEPLDDCPSLANPKQGGCPSVAIPDGGTVSSAVDAASGPGAKDADMDSLIAQTVDAKWDPPDVPVLPPADAVFDAKGIDIFDARVVQDLTLPRDEGPIYDQVLATPDVAVRLDSLGPEVADAQAKIDLTPTPDLKDASTPEVESDPVCDGPCPHTKTQGESCQDSSECASGQCADGVCCSNACLGACRSCNQPSANGICTGYTTGLDPEHECSTGSMCNGVGACGTVVATNLPNGQICNNTSQCKSGFCVDGVCCNSACADDCYSCGTGICTQVIRADDIPQCMGTRTCNKKGICAARAAN